MRVAVRCPVCGDENSTQWGSENGWTAVKCLACPCVYMNPQPSMAEVSQGARTGLHESGGGQVDTTGRHWPARAEDFKDRLGEILTPGDLSRVARWLDIGCGFGELLTAVGQMLPPGSHVEGIEPSERKRHSAERRGLQVSGRELSGLPRASYDYVSLMNVLSHVPAPAAFLREIARVLRPGGVLILLTGNGGDITRREYPGSLYLPDHLLFVGEAALAALLQDSGFTVVAQRRFESFFRESALLRLLKNVARLALRRPLVHANRGPYRDLLVKARAS
jgi:SAM-dependent methyltransferase